MAFHNGAELRGLPLDLRELCAELRGLDLRGGELGALAPKQDTDGLAGVQRDEQRGP